MIIWRNPIFSKEIIVYICNNKIESTRFWLFQYIKFCFELINLLFIRQIIKLVIKTKLLP
jgi:hypothetical protein